jgi:tetratricopeptide (TPR) repeat protein
MAAEPPPTDVRGASLKSLFVAHDPGGAAAAPGRDLARRWAAGERPLAEEYLADHPELADRTEAVVDLIYEEICQRQRHGEPVDSVALLARFPRWRERVQVLLDCHRLLGPGDEAAFPRPGETLAGCTVLAELGRGAEGCVYLATQPALADRPVVLKAAPPGGAEHLSLARLQHTHIVPLYAVHDDEGRGLRVLCMPYFGSAALHKLLNELRGVPPARRDGRTLLGAVDRLQHPALPPPARSPGRDFLARASYPQAVAWLGGCLAQGLHYAHERGLAHLDVKPANVLVAADGQPMLLDFHLAQPPLPAGAAPTWLGGTLLYMAPEQREALDAIHQRKPIPRPVDGRADLYSLGVLLYEALGGTLPVRAGSSPPPGRVNPAVSPGLSDIVMKCLAPDPRDRYADGAALAADLRRHLADEPLAGVHNRSVRERWAKWRRRHPSGLRSAALLVTTLVVLAVAALLWWERAGEARRRAAEQLAAGRELLGLGHVEAAAETLERAVRLAEAAPGAEAVAEEAGRLRRAARQTLAVAELGRLADSVRFLYPFDGQPPAVLAELEDRCRTVWERRDLVRDRLAAGGEAADRARVEADLLDLAVLGAALRVRVGGAAARPAALATLAEAESLFGPSAALSRERAALGGPPGNAPPPRTAWDHYALGRVLLRDGDPEAAAAHLDAAAALEPELLWPAFYQGQCAYRRGRHRDAVVAFSVCVGRAPRLAACPFNRALAFEALGDVEDALADYGRALALDPNLATGYLDRGVLRLRQNDYAAAATDLEAALRSGADPVAAHYNLALAHHGRGDRAGALANVEQALQLDPRHTGARELRDRLAVSSRR